MKWNSVFSLGSIALLTVGAAANADVITDWNVTALNAIRLERTPPPKASRALAMLHVAIYDAVNGIRHTHPPYLGGGLVPRSAAAGAAGAAAAHKVLVALFPAHAGTFNTNYQAQL